MDSRKVRDLANYMRRKIVDVSYNCELSAHIGGALSIVDILATLYGAVLKYDAKRPHWGNRDRFILSKGHGALGLYSALLGVGFITDETFESFQTNESHLTAHPVMNLAMGIESSNGSLGQGLSMGVGIALATKQKGRDFRTFVLLGNGECNEGSIWEAVMSASQFKLDNLVAIVDYNGFQNELEPSETILDLSDFEGKWKSFGWNVCSIDGHDVVELQDSFVNKNVENMPKVVIATTIKGKGVSFMENNNEWHHHRLTKAHYEQAVLEMKRI